MTSAERKLISIANTRQRLIQRIAKAGKDRKSTKDLQARLVDATRLQIRAEMRIEKGRAA